MISILDIRNRYTDYFNGLSNIVGLDNDSTVFTARWMKGEQVEFLRRTLGIKHANEFIEALPETDSESVWYKLLYGETYVQDDINYTWDGLLGDETILVSPLADYLF